MNLRQKIWEKFTSYSFDIRMLDVSAKNGLNEARKLTQ